MKRKRKIIIIAITVTAIILIAAFILITRDYVAIQDDGVCFDIGKITLFLIKGSPYEMHENDTVTPQKSYYYHENVHGYEADTTYIIVYNDLIEVSAWLKDITEEEAKELTEKIVANQKKEYGKKSTYFDEGFKETEAGFEYDHGTFNGAGGITLSFSYEESGLHIRANKLI